MPRHEYDMNFELRAQVGGAFNSAFAKAQKAVASMQKEIQALNKEQANIAAYQKQQKAVASTTSKLELLKKEYDNIQKEIAETGTYSSTLENKLLNKQRQIDKTGESLEQQTQKLNKMGDALREAGIDTDNLAGESERLKAEIADLKEAEEEAAEEAERFSESTANAFMAAGEVISAIGIDKVAGLVKDALVDCGKEAISFESAFTGVEKTVDGTDKQLAAIRGEIKGLAANELPATTEEISAVAEAAGQLGIATDNVVDFSEVMIDLGEATNLTAEEAASELAKIANITGTAADNYSNLGSVIVDLGNNYATTEAAIVDMATNLASAGTIAGLTEPEIMALAASMSSVGIEAAAGGTAMSQTLTTMEKAVVKGGDKLEKFAQVAGMSAIEFASAWESSPITAVQAFIAGLGNLEAKGESATLVLEDLGLSGIRQSNMLKSLSLAAETMNGAINTANNAWQEDIALTTEAEKRYATTESQLAILSNSYVGLKAAIGDTYLPAVKEASSVGSDVLNGITGFVEKNPALVRGVVTFTSVSAGAIAVVVTGTAAVKALSAAFGLLNLSMGPIALVAAGVAAVTAGVVALVSAANEGVPSMKELTEATRGYDEALSGLKTSYSDTIVETEATASVAQSYIDRLKELEGVENKSAAEQNEWNSTLELVAGLLPDVANNIDLTNHSIDGGTAALQANTDAWYANAKAQAYTEYMKGVQEEYNDVIKEQTANQVKHKQAEVALAKAQETANAARQRQKELMDEFQAEQSAYYDKYGTYAGSTAKLSDEYYSLNDTIKAAEKEERKQERTLNKLDNALEENAGAVEQAEADMSAAAQTVAELTAGTEDLAGANGELSAEQAEVVNAINSTLAPVGELVEKYHEAYAAALEDVQGQYAIWDTAAQVVSTSVDTINSGLQSQIDYWNNYNSNLENLRGRTADIEGLQEVIASFADGSTESVNAIAGMAAASDEDLAAMVANYQELQQAQGTTSESLAALQTDFDTQMAAIADSVSTAVSDMNLSSEASSAAQSTIQGFIDGANSMLPSVISAYSSIASAARSALNSGESGGSIPVSGHFASGTKNAPPGIALVGEEGPELVLFDGGEQVLNARETAALQGKMQNAIVDPIFTETLSQESNVKGSPIVADMGNDAGGTNYDISVSFQIDGNANNDTVSKLRDWGEEFAERVLEVISEAGIDAGRRMYA